MNPLTNDRCRFRSDSPETTVLLGRRLGELAEPGLILAMVGPLGAGKTQLVRGLAEGLDVSDPRVVSSPTFVLIQEYAGRLPIFHFDTYRLTSADQFAALGPEEYFESDGVCAVEWADRVIECLPEDRLDVLFHLQSPAARELTFIARGKRSHWLLNRLRTSFGTWQDAKGGNEAI